MVDKQTIEAYEQQAVEWAKAREAGDLDHVAWVATHRRAGPVVDLGCGPWWHLPAFEPPAIALDATAAMLALVPENAPSALRLRASADALPFAPGSLGGAVANRVYPHLPRSALPLALADLHRSLQPDAPVLAILVGDGIGTDFRAGGSFPGRLFSGWSDAALTDVVAGAGFDVAALDSLRPVSEPGRLVLKLRRAFTLPDTIGHGMRLLVCGLNPSVYSAEVGIGFGRPGNRFWPAALAAGLVSRDRDPRHALTEHGIGMTDLVKRPTRKAAELSSDEYRSGLARVERLATWLKPAAVCFVGLAGWRAAVDRRAHAGEQPRPLGGAPVYLMPSTSGLNAGSQLPDLIEHLRSAGRLADETAR